MIPRKSHKRSGMAYIYVIIAFAIIMILLTSIISMFSNNLAMAKLEEKQTQAYYVAMSGIELGRAALLQQQDPSNKDSTLLHEKFSTQVQADISNTPILGQKIKLDEGNGWVDIIVYAFEKKDSNRRWITIYSVGTLEDSKVSKTLRLSFPVDNSKEEEWDRN